MKRLWPVLFLLLAAPCFAQTSQSLDVTWTPPATVGGSGTIAGYNLYECVPSASETACAPTDSWQKVNQGLETSPGYVIAQSALPNPTYSFYVTTVDSAGNESALSAIYTITPAWASVVAVKPNAPACCSSKIIGQ